MLRIIITTTDCGAAANVGGPVIVRHKTFDVPAPEVEAFLNAQKKGTYVDSFISGVEVRVQSEGSAL